MTIFPDVLLSVDGEDDRSYFRVHKFGKNGRGLPPLFAKAGGKGNYRRVPYSARYAVQASFRKGSGGDFGFASENGIYSDYKRGSVSIVTLISASSFPMEWKSVLWKIFCRFILLTEKEEKGEICRVKDREKFAREFDEILSGVQKTK